ncbi:MAG: site-specific DNA-methyltransferase [Verrucomicrobiota bacterium]
MTKKGKLELTWIGKDARPRLEPRILLEDPERSHHAAHRVTDHDLFDNRLIFGDNLLALKALEQEFAGKIKCEFIDPPYNTGSAFEHYDDGVEHSIWLSLMRDRIEILRRLLRPDGSLWITIDDNEAHYLKILCDEVFGRRNFVANLVWQKRTARDNRKAFSVNHDHVLVYAVDISLFTEKRNLLPLTTEALARYKNPDNDPRGSWQSVAMTAQGGHATAAQFYELKTPTGKRHNPPEGLCWIYTKEKFEAEVRKKNIYFPKNSDGVPRIKKFLKQDASQGLVPESIWLESEVGTNDDAKRHTLELLRPSANEVFETPKPEGLLNRVLQISTNPGDWVLDSFAGSGTTGAVAQKMGRRWIMVELGEHCHTHIIPRLKKVIDGADPGGITEAADWKGGGGFRYYRLAPSLLEKDKWGQWVISKEFNAAMLAEAVCKLEGFTYAPSDTIYWQHGHSTERDFIYVTTQHLSADQLAQLSDEVGPERTLLVLCAAFRVLKGGTERYPNLTVKKIPKQVLSRCEWGHDDYSLKVENLPKAPPKAGQQEFGLV